MIAESYVGYKHRKTIGIERNVVVRAYKYHPSPRQSDTVSHKNINLAAQNTACHHHTSSLLSPIRSGRGSGQRFGLGYYCLRNEPSIKRQDDMRRLMT